MPRHYVGISLRHDTIDNPVHYTYAKLLQLLEIGLSTLEEEGQAIYVELFLEMSTYLKR